MYSEIGKVSRVLGPIVHVKDVVNAHMMELVEVGEDRLIGEIVRLEGRSSAVQVYEDTTGLKPGSKVYGSGMPLSVELGPGLIGSIYDGVQRPLEKIKDKSGFYIQKGVKVEPLDRDKQYSFKPVVNKENKLHGSVLRFITPKPGKVKKVSGMEEVLKLEGVVTGACFIKPGDVVNPIQSGTDRPGYLVTRGVNREDAIKIADIAESLIKIETEES